MSEWGGKHCRRDPGRPFWIGHGRVEGGSGVLAQGSMWPCEQQLEGLCYVHRLQASFSPAALPVFPAELLSNRTCVASLVIQMVKNLPVPQVRSLGWDDPLEKEMATHSIILA